MEANLGFHIKSLLHSWFLSLCNLSVTNVCYKGSSLLSPACPLLCLVRILTTSYNISYAISPASAPLEPSLLAQAHKCQPHYTTLFASDCA